MRKIVIVLLVILGASFYSHGQVSFLKKLELKIVSEKAFSTSEEELDEFAFYFESQKWSVDVLTYLLNEMQLNPYLSWGTKIKVKFYNPSRSKKIELTVPISGDYVRAFRTKEGFDEKHIDFLQETSEWIMEYL